MFYFLCLDVDSECVIFSFLFKNFLLSLYQAFFCFLNHFHHAVYLGNQNVLFLLFGLGILVFALNFLIFKFTDFTLQNLVSLVDFSGLFFCLLILLFESLKFVLVFFLLLLSLFKFETFRVELELNLFRLLLNLGFLRLVQHESLVHLVKLVFEQITSDIHITACLALTFQVWLFLRFQVR